MATITIPPSSTGAPSRITLDLVNQRVAAVPLETNSALAVPDGDRLHLSVGSQNVFSHRNAISRSTGFDRDRIHAMVPDMGGGFGAKFYVYPEQHITARLALDLGRPVRWHESRRDNLQGMTQGRGQRIVIELGADADAGCGRCGCESSRTSVPIRCTAPPCRRGRG